MNQKKEGGADEKDKVKASVSPSLSQKNKLAEMVYEAKKKILQGSLTVLSP
jgi:hypothetical protein